MTRRRGGPIPRISREQIEQAVIDVGFDTATTTTVARHLGVDQSSLYRHIGSREEMMLGAVDRVLAVENWDPDATDWRDYLRAQARTLWNVLRQHPGLASQLYALDTLPATTATATVRGVAVLRRSGWTVPDAILVMDTISDMTGDAINQVESADRQGRRSRTQLAGQYASAEVGSDALAGEIAAHISRVFCDDPQAWWERKLDLIIAGAERLLEDGRG